VLAPGRWLWLRTIAWVALLFAVAVAVVSAWPIYDKLAGEPLRPPPLMFAAASVALIYLAYTAAVWFGEKRRPDELEPSALAFDLFAGLVVGLAMFCAVFLSLRLIGAYAAAPGHGPNWPRAVAFNLLTGLVEELVFRAIVFRLLMRAFGVWPALALSAALFGGLHMINPNASPAAAVAIAVEAGLMLAAFYLLTGRLWMSIGVHAAWNFAQGSIFGARVSGLAPGGSLFVSAPRPGVPAIVSGGAFGPEASLPAMFVGTAVFVVVIGYLAWRSGRGDLRAG
jgi:hypothetical protein